MRDSNMTDEWVKAQWAKNPCVKLANGDIRTGPVRLSFANILKPSKPTQQKPDGNYGAVLLFPAGVDISVLQNEMRDVALAKWPDAGKPGGPKLFKPIRDQDIDGKGQPGEADRYAGYERGAMRIGANANQKVPCVDQRLAPIVEGDKVYSGVWAIVTVRCYTFEQQANKGPTFGLQAVMIVADDTNLGGTGSANPQEAFAGVSVEAGDINADAAFGAGEKASAPVIDPFA
jgi:hypothetical protein